MKVAAIDSSWRVGSTERRRSATTMSPAPRSRKRGCDAAPQGRSSARSDPTRVQRRARGPLHSEGYRRGPQTATTSRTRWYCGGYLTDYPTQSTGLKGTRLEQPNRTPILALRRRNADARQRIRERDLLGKEKHWMPANCTRCIPRAGSAGAGQSRHTRAALPLREARGAIQGLT